MPYIKVYIHFVWSTKMRQSFLETREIRQRVWKHILENAKQKGIFVDFVNGYSNHCHCLLSLCFDQSIQKLMQLIKGESSFWINRDPECMEILKGRKSEWQDEYYAVSETIADSFAWIGLYKSFERAGFEVVDKTSKNRPMVRYYTNNQ